MFGFREQIAPGAFNDAIKDDDVRALFNHDPNILLGRTASGTLQLTTDKRGLKYSVDLPDTAAARDVRELIRRGDVSGSSFGFMVDEDEWDERDVKNGKLPLRTILKASLFDVSPVTYPAYPQTSVSARSRAQAIGQTAKQTREETERRALESALATLNEAKAKAV
jgi:HK97 family phage prohead protease